MPDKKILRKDGIEKEFNPRAAQIAIAHLGWSEVIPLPKPIELITKGPVRITKPVELIKEVIEPKVEEIKSTVEPPAEVIKPKTIIKNIAPKPKRITKSKKK